MFQRRFIAAIALSLLASASAPALAKDLDGRFAIGGQIEPLLPVFDDDFAGALIPGGFSVKGWVGVVGFQGIIGFVTVSSDFDSSTVAAAALRVLFNVARAEDTNLFIGAGMRFVASESDDNPLGFDVLVGVEHFFGNHFSVAGHVGLGLTMFERVDITQFGNAAAWGTSFHFYF